MHLSTKMAAILLQALKDASLNLWPSQRSGKTMIGPANPQQGCRVPIPRWMDGWMVFYGTLIQVDYIRPIPRSAHGDFL
jgi:hypothetical protein